MGNKTNQESDTTQPEQPTFALNDRVILADGMSGVIVGILLTVAGTTYEVAVVHNGERKTSYFQASELSK